MTACLEQRWLGPVSLTQIQISKALRMKGKVSNRHVRYFLASNLM